MDLRVVGAALVAAPLVLGISACGPASGPSPPTLEAVRQATEKYKDVNAALADGYIRDWMNVCETPYYLGLTDHVGVMGLHFLRRDLLGIQEDETRLDVTGTHTDFLRPASLLYEPRGKDVFELVAIENIVSAAAWEAKGHRQPPSFQGVAFDYWSENAALMTKARYDLRIWLYRDNPKGIYAAYNPKVTCEHHEYDMPMMMPMPHHKAGTPNLQQR